LRTIGPIFCISAIAKTGPEGADGWSTSGTLSAFTSEPRKVYVFGAGVLVHVVEFMCSEASEPSARGG
jgi:hypothetical protein